MSISFEVELKTLNPNGIFYSGQTLAGLVRLKLTKPKRVKSISVMITGSGRVSWTSYSVVEAENKIDTVEYSGNEEYISCKVCSYTSDNGTYFELKAGEHIYNFNYVLPFYLPSSFEGTHGYIRYAIDIILEIPWKFDRTFKRPFSICRTLDLNQNLSVKLPSQIDYKKEYYLSRLRNDSNIGYIQITMKTMRSGFTFGETIPVEIEVVNCCGFSLNKIITRLRKIIIYRCDFPTIDAKEESIDIAECALECLLENDRKSFLARIEVPLLQPTTSTFCKVINIGYDIKTEAIVPGLPNNPILAMPIVIGTVPLGTVTPQTDNKLTQNVPPSHCNR